MKSTSPVPSCVCLLFKSHTHTRTTTVGCRVTHASARPHPTAQRTWHHQPTLPPHIHHHHTPPPPLPSIPSTVNYSFLFLLLTCPGPKTPESNKHRGLAFTCSTVHSLLSRRVLSSQFVASSVSILPFRTRLDDWVKSRQEYSRGTRLTNSGDANSLALLGVLPVHPLGSKEGKKVFPLQCSSPDIPLLHRLCIQWISLYFSCSESLAHLLFIAALACGYLLQTPSPACSGGKKKNTSFLLHLFTLSFLEPGKKITFYFYFIFY